MKSKKTYKYSFLRLLKREYDGMVWDDIKNTNSESTAVRLQNEKSFKCLDNTIIVLTCEMSIYDPNSKVKNWVKCFENKK